MVHRGRPCGAPFDVVLEIVGIASHDDRDAMAEKQSFQPLELVVPDCHVVAAREKRMTYDRHGRLAGGTPQRAFEPTLLLGVDFPQDPRVDGEEGEAIRLNLEERRSLKPGRYAVRLTQACRFLNQTFDPAVGRARQTQV